MSAVMVERECMSWLAVLKERFVYGLIFLFPVAGVGVRHWFSAIFVLLFFVSIWDLFKYRGQRSPLFKEERIWLWLCAAFFATFIVSALVNGWERPQNRAFGVDVRFLMIVPVYLMLRQYVHAWRYLLAGLVCAAVFLAVQAYCDIYELSRGRAQGVYSPNLLGPVAVLVSVWLLSGWKLLGRWRWVVPVAVVCALWAAAMSGSRGGFVAAIVLGLVWCWCSFKSGGRWIGLVLTLVAPVVIYHVSDSVAQRVDEAADELKTYVNQLDQGNHYAGGSAPVRLEMWRLGWQVFLDNPLLGVGRGNYTETVQAYVDKGLAPPQVAHHGHAHNAFVDVLMARGIVGFAVFLGMLFYPLYYLFKTRELSPETALFGILHIVGISVLSLTDASTFIKGNFVVIYLLFFTIFFSWHVRQVREKES